MLPDRLCVAVGDNAAPMLVLEDAADTDDRLALALKLSDQLKPSVCVVSFDSLALMQDTAIAD